MVPDHQRAGHRPGCGQATHRRYRRRWWIEVYFCIIKRLEALQLRTVERALVLYLFVAWRILMLMTIGQEHPEGCWEVVFSVEEWQTA